MNKNLLSSALAVAFTFSMGNAQASNVIDGLTIDNFDTGAQTVPSPGTNTVTGLSVADTIGGARTVGMTSVGLAGATAAVFPLPLPGGIFSHSADSLTSATSTITWAGLGGVDFVGELVDNQFKFDILSIDLGNVNLILTVTDSGGNSDSFTLAGAGVGPASIDYSSFAGVDLTAVDALSLEIIGGESADLTLDSFATMGAVVHPPVSVPEPAPLALMAIGLLALGLRRRKVK